MNFAKYFFGENERCKIFALKSDQFSISCVINLPHIFLQQRRILIQIISKLKAIPGFVGFVRVEMIQAQVSVCVGILILQFNGFQVIIQAR